MGDTRDSVVGKGPAPTPQPNVEDRIGALEKAFSFLSSGKKGKKGKKKALQATQGTLLPGNLISQMQGIMDELSKLIIIKLKDVETEGDAMRADNLRKVAKLKTAYTLLMDVQNELSDMYS